MSWTPFDLRRARPSDRSFRGRRLRRLDRRRATRRGLQGRVQRCAPENAF
jgi:hypothetical protein